MSEVAAFPMFIEHPGDIADHPLVLALGGGERLGALGLYGVVGAWAAHYTADGVVPESVVSLNNGWRNLSSALVACGLWAYDDERKVYRYLHWPKPSTESNGYGS